MVDRFWFKTNKRSVTCPYCGKTYHFIEDVVAVFILQAGCGCEDSPLIEKVTSALSEYYAELEEEERL